MTPTRITPEYTLLNKLVGKAEVHRLALNHAAIEKAVSDGYVQRLGNYVFITEEGIARFDELSNR